MSYIFQAEDRFFDASRKSYASEELCEAANGAGNCEERGSGAKPWRAVPQLLDWAGRPDERDDLVAVSDNESIIFSTGWGTRLEPVVQQVNHE